MESRIQHLFAQSGQPVLLRRAPRAVGQGHFGQAGVKARLKVSPVKVGPVLQVQRLHQFCPSHLSMQDCDEFCNLLGYMWGNMWGNMMGAGIFKAWKGDRQPVGRRLD